MSHLPPPTHSSPAPSLSDSTHDASPAPKGWKAKMKARGAVLGKTAIDKATVVSDKVGGKVNHYAEKKFGTEHFMPVSGDFGREMDKCARILRAFTVEGVVSEEPDLDSRSSTPTADNASVNSKSKRKSKKVLRKIPPRVIASAKGLVIFTSLRTGVAPFGGAGGSGIVIARLPDGTWSAPSSISPNNLSAGFLLGLDVFDVVLVINSQQVLDSFKTHKVTLGAEIGIAAGPHGSGASVESGIERTPIFSYVRSRGLYAGVEVIGQVFVERSDENAAMYNWPGVKAGEILAGKVPVPPEAAELHRAISDAETGRAQAAESPYIDARLADSHYTDDLSDPNLGIDPAHVTSSAVSTPPREASPPHRRPPPPPPPHAPRVTHYSPLDSR